jgi:hypothetical protein
MSPGGRRIAIAGVLVATLGLAGAYLRLRATVESALTPVAPDSRPLQFVTVPVREPLEAWGGGEVDGVAVTPDGLLTAGGSGVDEAPGGHARAPLPTRRASALVLWRGRPVAALSAGGVFLRRETGWEELRSGWGTLHVRDLQETAGGELLLGAREGLFRAAWGGDALVRLHDHPVRQVAGGEGGPLLSAGEDGLWRVGSGTPAATRVSTPDPWVESVARVDGRVYAVTAAGLARGENERGLVALGEGQDVTSGCTDGRRFYGVAAGIPAVLRVETEGRIVEERLAAAGRRVLCVAGEVFADTDEGLYRRATEGWVLARPRPAALPVGPSHVSALAWLGTRLVVGLFDGGLVSAEPQAGAPAWRAVGGSAAWGVNALLPAGGSLYVASLRGAARFDGRRLVPIDGPGAAFSLASTVDGVAIGYGQGVLLPGARLVSAFHGLPGNQALALLSGDALLVGTPSGLGAVQQRRVRWSVTPGQGQLPHPWVTALARQGETVFVGTYGGGIVRRSARGGEVTAGRFDAFVETEGLKVNPGGLVEADGRLYAATDGRGLWRLARDGSRFERLDLPLPSPRLTALVGGKDGLWVGTDEGLAKVPFEALRQAAGESR